MMGRSNALNVCRNICLFSSVIELGWIAEIMEIKSKLYSKFIPFLKYSPAKLIEQIDI
jgi:hypothetical protein